VSVTSTEAIAEGTVVELQEGWHTVARVVFPADRDEDTLALYVEHGRRISATDDDLDDEPERVQGTGGDTHGEDIRSRRSTVIRAGSRVSFATYFNAFPASYWRRWTVVQKVRLVVRIKGQAIVLVYRSNARGTSQRVDSRTAEGGVSTIAFDLDLLPFGDGGWYWFDVIAGKRSATLVEADWLVQPDPVRPGRLSIGVTTINRTSYCKALIDTVGSSPELRAVLDKIYFVDQGSQKVEDEPGWAESAAVLGDQLEVIHQANLGGSGGFSRGMYETVTAGNSDYHMMLDDDVNIETEGIVRALSFATFCRRPTLVGGHMFDMFDRSVLHAFGEEIDRWRWLWGSVRGLGHRHDLAQWGLRETPWMHRRVDVDYNGWWMCLVPTEVIKEIGLSLPVFIKWDDAEYGLRAKKAGYPTVTFPGSAVWHVSWIDKDDGIDWQAYYHERNRLLVAMLYSPYTNGGRLLRESIYNDIKHAFSMQYYAEELRLMALRDLLSGPAHLHATLGNTLPKLRAIGRQFDDARYSADPDVYPLPARERPPRKGKTPTEPKRTALPVWALATAVKQLRPPSPMSRSTPEVNIPHDNGRWWVLSQYDSAVVTKADGTGAAFYKRRPARFREQLAESARLRTQLRRDWTRLSEQYKRQLPSFTSMETWAKTFGIERADRE